MSKIAFITGATSGIGKATAQILAANGFSLIITGRRNDRLEALGNLLKDQYKVDVNTLCFDVRSLEEVESSVNSLPEKWKNIDLLVNNAGLAVGMEPVNAGVTDDWERMIDTNVKGLLYVSKTVSPLMVERRKGQIINISSIAGRESYPNGAVYCGTKHAVQAITKAMRMELLPYNIKVSTLAPGMVETEFSVVRFKGDQQRADNVYNGIDPLTANDIAETILFMATRPAHVCIDDILIMPTAQASARDVHRNI
jgi:hypothetical protein